MLIVNTSYSIIGGQRQEKAFTMIFLFLIYSSLFDVQTIDMTYFLLIMVVFLMAYGVAQQAILFPHEHGSWSLIPKVFFRPYFQVYGELFIEDTTYSGKLSLLFFP